MDARTGVDSPNTGIDGLNVGRRWITISPLNKRRWESFTANRRGYWSMWLFLAMFLISLFAEFIANDKPIFIYVNGKSFFPAVMTYPDSAFGQPGDKNLFGTAADYRDDYLMDLIVKENGIVIWPLVRFSYNTQVSKPPSPFPSKPTWLLNEVDCEFAATHNFAKCDEIEFELARHRRWRARRGGAADLWFPYFRAVRAGADHRVLGHRRRCRRGTGLFRRLGRSFVPALHRNLDLDTVAISAADHFIGAGARILRAARNSAAVFLGVAGRACARGIPARPQFRIYPGRARASACRTR